MNKDDILKEIEKISVETTDDMAKVEALIFLHQTYTKNELKEKNKEHAKEMSEFFAKSFEFGYGE